MLKKSIQKRLEQEVLVFDGAIGTEIYRRGFFVNVSFEELCISRPDIVREIHAAYIESGAMVLTTNSYAANRNHLSKHGLGDHLAEINQAAVQLARAEANDSTLIAGSVGPAHDPQRSGDFDDDSLHDILIEHIHALQVAKVDFIIFETLSSKADVRRACLAIQEFPSLPYILSVKLDEGGESPRGETLEVLMEPVEKCVHEPAALGINCGGGAAALLEPFQHLRDLADYPVIVQPNAGLPKSVDNRMIYMLSEEYFATYGRRYVDLGARGIGGCCGVGPSHIAELARIIRPVLASEFSHRLHIRHDTKKIQPPPPMSERSGFGAALAAGEWLTSVEIVPPRGFDLQSTIDRAIQCREAGIHTINIPDGPRASSRISPIVTARNILEKAGIEPILHVCCRDKNLISMQSDLLGCAADGIHNILFITGDPPKLGDYAFASGVFDVDAIGIVKYVSRLNHGIDFGDMALKEATATVIGVGADPNALDMDRELRRTREKVAAGAEYIITQPIFEASSLLRFLDAIKDLHIPVIAGMWPLASYRNAEFMRNEVPGVTVPDKIMERMAAHHGKDEQLACGIQIAREIVETIRDHIQGIQVSAPFGKVEAAIEVIKGSA